MMTVEQQKNDSNLKMEGEGSREGSRRYQEAQHEFAQNADVRKKAKEAAAALDGEEAGELEKARQAAAQGKTTEG
ncbi:MAG: hypothetical protein V7676_16395 [Parasphingorhabdus sp.]|uniref:hypothetical protein n=1 Tax=Parasphingorhabdus sp. TaxID=2709688 RepID=UPI0030011E09